MLLMQSGIGEEAELTNAGITVLHALPGVGRNLHDHVSFGAFGKREDTVAENPKKPDIVLLELFTSVCA
jgi:choline dehydrogenase-like flavoprotein